MFTTVEGLDGAGGTTLVEGLSDSFTDTVVTSEPSDLEYGRLVRQNLSDDTTDPIVDFFLFMADRQHHIEERIRPADDEGKLVISDRYADSTRAYQPVSLAGVDSDKPFDSPWQAKLFIEQTMAHWNYEPDLTLYLDISVDTALERADCDEKYETRRFLNRVKDNYDSMAELNDRIVTIDGEQSKERVLADAISAIDDYRIARWE